MKTALLAPLALAGMIIPASTANAATVHGCTSPAVVHDGLIQLTCFPSIPSREFPTGSEKCRHLDSYVTGTSATTVKGIRYTITTRFREDVEICR
jgi:hypothetical protein